MKIKEKIGLIGVGNMGTAILEGLLEKKLVDAGQITVFDKIGDKASEFSKKWKAALASSNAEVVKKSDAVILAVKPQDLAATAGEIGSVAGKMVISILAGMPVAKLSQAMTGARVVRAMPNLGAKVGQGITAVTSSDKQALAVAEAIFSGCGKTVVLEEKHFDLVTAVSGSGPAYFFLLMELLENAAVKEGLTREQARLLSVQTAVGAGLLAASSSDSPEELRKQVTSKGGTTEAALKVFEQNKIADIVSQAVKAAVDRGKELAKG